MNYSIKQFLHIHCTIKANPIKANRNYVTVYIAKLKSRLQSICRCNKTSIGIEHRREAVRFDAGGVVWRLSRGSTPEDTDDENNQDLFDGRKREQNSNSNALLPFSPKSIEREKNRVRVMSLASGTRWVDTKAQRVDTTTLSRLQFQRRTLRRRGSATEERKDFQGGK